MNTTAHLVARALRDRRTITWVYITGGGYNPYRSLTRSQILKDVLYDASRPPSTNGRYGLQAYRIEPPIPQPPAHDHAAELVALRLERIAADFAALGETDKRYTLLQLQASLTAKNALN